FVASDAAFLISGAASRIAFGHKAIELLDVNRVRKIRIEQVIAVTIEKEVLFERLIAVERLANVRHRRVKILGDAVEIHRAPKGVNDRMFRRAAVSAGGNETEDVVRPPGRPGVCRERTLRVTEDFKMTE